MGCPIPRGHPLPIESSLLVNSAHSDGHVDSVPDSVVETEVDVASVDVFSVVATGVDVVSVTLSSLRGD